MDNRKKFLTKLSQDNPTRLEQAIALLWYYNVKQEYEERSASDLVSDLEEDSFGRPNITKLRTGLKKSKLTVSGSRPDTFRINAAHFSELSKKYGHLINFIETEVTSSVLPIESFQGKRIYLERMVNQINGSYDYGFYDACAVMIRRLMESLIIEIFFNKNRVSEIKSNNVIISFWRRKSEGGQKFLPPNPLPFCPPELKSFSKFSIRIFAKKSSDFVQRSEPNCMLRVYCLGRSPLR